MKEREGRALKSSELHKQKLEVTRSLGVGWFM